jgi:putative DNA primase/helicase
LATFTPIDFPEKQGNKTTYIYSDNQWIERIDTPNGKKVLPFHSGSEKAGKGDKAWPMYREPEARAHGRGKFVLMSEGEKCVERPRSIGLIAVTFQGGSWTETEIESGILRLKNSGIAGIAYVPDNDKPGFNKAKKVADACAKWEMPYVEISPKSLNITEEKGDIADYIKEKLASGMAPEQIRETLERIFQESADQYRTLNLQSMEIVHQETDSRPTKLPKPSATVNTLSQLWDGKFTYDQQAETWREWNGVFWETKKSRDIKAEIFQYLQGNQWEFNNSYINGVEELLTISSLRTPTWNTPPSNLINFKNGVLNLDTKQLTPHSQKYGFLHCINRDYLPLPEIGNPLDMLAKYAPIFSQWLDFSFNKDNHQKLRILAMIAGVIRGDFAKSEKFVHIIGRPGTGKGTLLRTMQKIIGKESCASSSLKNLCGSGNTSLFALSAIIDSWLVICPDEKKVTDNLEVINKLCGKDDIDFREPYGKAVGQKPFHGTLMAASNRWPYKGDCTGIDRRLFLVQMDRPVKKAIDFEAKLESELSAITSIALSLPVEQVLSIIDSNDGSSPLAWNLKQENCSVASWMEIFLTLDENAKGVQLSELSNHFKKWCEDTGETFCAPKKFLRLVTEYSQEIFDHTVTKGVRNRSGNTVNGIRLARPSEDPLSSLLTTGCVEPCVEPEKCVEPSKEVSKTQLKPRW